MTSDPIEAFLRERFPDLIDIDPDLDLIENRIIDSLQIVEFISAVEFLAGRQIDLDEVSVDDFRSVRAVRRLISANTSGQTNR